MAMGPGTGAICRVIKDCLLCVQQIGENCIWDANLNPQYDYQCRAGVSDVETTHAMQLFSTEEQCAMGRTGNIQLIEVPVAVPVTTENHVTLDLVLALLAAAFGSIPTIVAMIYVIKKRYCRRAVQDIENVELIDNSSRRGNVVSNTIRSESESERADIAHQNVMCDLERIIRAARALPSVHSPSSPTSA